jgi:cyclohexyl-isocyanide hydratase
MSDVHLVAGSRDPVRTDVGIPVQPAMTFDECPSDLDVVFVPGGLAGSIAAMGDQATLAFLADRGSRARWVTSVCTGSLVLGAAGLLKGYKATSHWDVRDLRPLMGAEVSEDRVVTNRNRITAGGVTAGIDFGLALAAQLRGEDYAKRIQLSLEYDPKPPYSAGSPRRGTRDHPGCAATPDQTIRPGLPRRMPAAEARNSRISARLRLGDGAAFPAISAA